MLPTITELARLVVENLMERDLDEDGKVILKCKSWKIILKY
jgi:hypothetical protein